LESITEVAQMREDLPGREVLGGWELSIMANLVQILLLDLEEEVLKLEFHQER